MGGLRKELDLGSEEEDGWFEEGARPLFDVCGFVGLWVWWAWWVICGHELDETHDKWGAVSGL